MNDNDETIILKKIDAVYLRVFCTIGQSIELKNFFECYAPNYRWNPKFKMGFWNGKISFYDMKQKILPIGLLPNLVQFCKNFNYKLQFDFDVDNMSNDIEQTDLDEFYKAILTNGKYSLQDTGARDYQNTCVLAGIKNKRGVFEIGTGGGKSLSIYAIIRFLRGMNKRVLLIVPNIGLVEQMYSDFSNYGWQGLPREVEKLYARYSSEFNKHDPKPVLISTWQSLIDRPSAFFQEFDAVLVDETQSAKCVSIQKILKACTKAEYRLGFTGTLPDEKADLYTIHGFLGPTLYSINSGELIERGILSKIIIANLILKYPIESVKECHGRDYNYEIDYTLAYEPRNSVLDYILDNTPKDNNTLILVSRIEKHLKPITEHLKRKYPDKELHVIYGQTDALDRERIRAKMEKSTGIILLATYQTIGAGFNVKNLHQIVFFSSYKAKIKVLQAIGRGLRTHKSKEQLIVFDVIDDLSYVTRNKTIHLNHLATHFIQRRKYYNRSGFKYQNKIIYLQSINTNKLTGLSQFEEE